MSHKALSDSWNLNHESTRSYNNLGKMFINNPSGHNFKTKSLMQPYFHNTNDTLIDMEGL